MATAITPLANLTLGSNAATVTFSSISGSYRDLRLIIQSGGASNSGARVRINGDSGANYSVVLMRGSGTSAVSNAGTNTEITIGYDVYSTSVTSVYTVDFFDYSATDKHKTVLSRGNNAATSVEAAATRWANTAAITSLTITMYGGDIASGSSFALYGVSA